MYLTRGGGGGTSVGKKPAHRVAAATCAAAARQGSSTLMLLVCAASSAQYPLSRVFRTQGDRRIVVFYLLLYDLLSSLCPHQTVVV